MIQIPPKKREEVLEKFDYLCAYCLDDATEIDHVIPRSWNCSNIDDNLVACCSWCNSHLSNKIFNENSISIQFEKKQKYIRKLKLKIKKEDSRSVCGDYGMYFRPFINGATLLLCSECNSYCESSKE